VFAPHKHRAGKVLVKLFQKLAVSKGGALVARRNARNFLNGAFLFAKLFLLRLLQAKEKAGNKFLISSRLHFQRP